MTLPGPLLTTTKLHGQRKERDRWAPSCPLQGFDGRSQLGAGEEEQGFGSCVQVPLVPDGSTVIAAVL